MTKATKHATNVMPWASTVVAIAAAAIAVYGAARPLPAPPAPVTLSDHHLDGEVADLQRQVTQNTAIIAAEGRDIMAVRIDQSRTTKEIADLEQRIGGAKTGTNDPRLSGIIEQLHVLDWDMTAVLNRLELRGKP
jgi:hypothetical protein